MPNFSSRFFFSSRFSMPFALVHGGKVIHPQSQTEATGHLPLTSDPGPLPSMQDAASQLHRPHELGIHSLWLWVRWPCQAIPGTPREGRRSGGHRAPWCKLPLSQITHGSSAVYLIYTTRTQPWNLWDKVGAAGGL